MFWSSGPTIDPLTHYCLYKGEMRCQGAKWDTPVEPDDDFSSGSPGALLRPAISMVLSRRQP